MRYAIAVGSNRGDRAAQIAAAAAYLEADAQVRVVARAPVVETAPVGGPGGQGAYLNTAWIVDTDLGPHQLLHRLQVIETALGRSRTVHWGSRTIDLDLLLSDPPHIVASGVLSLPHPRMADRPFVLEPLVAVAPQWRHPVLGLTVVDLFSRLQRRR